MRPILVQIPSKLLFFVALAVAVFLFARDMIRRRRAPGTKLTANPILLVVGALAIVKFRSPTGSFIPESGTFSQAWLPVPIYAYGVMLGTSMIVGWFLAMRFAKQDGLSTDDAAAIYMWSAVYSIIGARVLWYLTTPGVPLSDLPKVWSGGLVAYGGMIGGFLASWYNCRKRKIPLLQWVDVGSPSVVLGTGITRMGCFLFGCDFGRRSDLPWAVKFPGPTPLNPQGSPAWQHHVRNLQLITDKATESLPVHPTQLYELLVGFSLFGLLMVLRRYRKFSGQVFLGWVIGYGILRPLIEIFRGDDDRNGIETLGLSTSQFIGIVSVVLGTGLMIVLLKRYRRDPEASRLWLRPVLAAAGPVGDAGSAGVGARKRKKRR